MKNTRSKELFERAQKSLVGGVNSPVRAFNSVGGDPLFIDRAEGIHIFDVDGNEYIDLVGSYGPMILGHAHPKVKQAVKEAVDKSFTYGATTLAEVEMGEMIQEAFPQIDKVRFVNSGTEAVISAIRLARAATDKKKIIKFAGCYHGHSDALLVAAGSGLATLGIPSSKGVPEEAVNNTLISNYNDLESVQKWVDMYPNEIAGIFIEPVAGNMGVIEPEMDFMKGLRKLCDDNGILLVIDEVMTGFRKKFGGAQDHFGIAADITCMGKVIGGGMPVGAYAAKAELMDQVAPLGGMYQAGTLSGSPISMACGLATLKELKNQDYDRADQLGKRVKAKLEAAADKAGIKVQVNQFGLMVNPFFTETPVRDFETAQTSDQAMFSKFFWAVAEAGLYIPPSQFEAWFLPIVLTDEEVEEIERRIEKAFELMK
ncbi:MAG: glutamate-1-semialdehyde-2,1-aminomutase [Flavobacteriales bacterium]|nr:glutamate-1-semialdehyde-2,1-aminomutase [Flavobacteriales bacterium]